MRRYQFFCTCIASIGLFLFAGCSTVKSVHQRGWVGGRYQEADTSLFRRIGAHLAMKSENFLPALPDEIKKDRSSAVYVSEVYENTPMFTAGVRQGDLILSIDGKPVYGIQDFRKIVDRCPPGTEIPLKLFRENAELEKKVTVGRETFKKWHSISLGFGLGTEFDPIPNPEFNIFGLFCYNRRAGRPELNSPEYRYIERISAQANSNPHEQGYVFNEGWRAWFVILGVSGEKEILAQEPADPAAALP